MGEDRNRDEARMLRQQPAPQLLPPAEFRRSGGLKERLTAADEIRGGTAQVVATDVSKLLLPANPKRKFLSIVNDNALGYVRVAFGVDATLAVGLKCAAGGGGFLLDNHVPTTAVFIIGSIALNSDITMVVA